MEADRVQGQRSQAIVRYLFPSVCGIALILGPGRPRSGFSFLSTPDGILLHGGYCKEYVKGSRPVGVMLDDTWFLRCVTTLAVLLTPTSR